MKYLSLFTGIGGFELGIQQAYEKFLLGCEALPNKKNKASLDCEFPYYSSSHYPIKENHENNNRLGLQEQTTENLSERESYDKSLSRGRPTCIGYSEIDKYATQIYQKHFPNHKNYGDITKINTSELPDFDFLCGGFPCQAFSIAGKRKGFEDTRGTLFFEIARILRDKQPRLFLLENVKGLLSHDNGKTFATIITTLDELGYDLQWQVLNSKNFGVPQNRERVFIIGHLRGTSRPEVFPIGETIRNHIEVVGELNSETWGKRNESIRRVYGTDGLAPTIPTGTGGGVMPKIVSPTNRRTEYHTSDISNTLTSHFRGSPDGDGRPAVLQDMKIRRLTPTECERLQGFPDGWTEGVSDTQRYKTLGNAVTVNVIQAIMEKLL